MCGKNLSQLQICRAVLHILRNQSSSKETYISYISKRAPSALNSPEHAIKTDLSSTKGIFKNPSTSYL